MQALCAALPTQSGHIAAAGLRRHASQPGQARTSQECAGSASGGAALAVLKVARLRSISRLHSTTLLKNHRFC